MSELTHLLVKNKQWASAVQERNPEFFSALTGQQAPKYLWIGCADSRVPANELVGLQSGELFVHRNVANVVSHSDLNCLSVIQYAIDHLQVEHVMVVGHSGCGGVHAALEGLRIGLADNWVRHVGDVVDGHREWLATLEQSRRWQAACELNVLAQAMNVANTTVLQDAWRRGQKVTVHGWVYELCNGVLNDLHISIQSEDQISNAYKVAIGKLVERYSQPEEA